MLKRLRKWWGKRRHPLRDFWRWAKKPGPKGEFKRFGKLTQFAARQANAAHHKAREAAEKKNHKLARKHRRREKMWRNTQAVYRSRRRRAYRRWQRSQRKGSSGGAPNYQPWMLNGNSGNIDDDLKPVVSYLVVVRSQYITDTYDYYGHTPTSLHYPRNDPTSPQQGRAVDAAGGDMCGAATALANQFNDDLLELFSPCGWFIKHGARYSNPGGGAFPGHGDHIHAGRD